MIKKNESNAIWVTGEMNRDGEKLKMCFKRQKHSQWSPEHPLRTNFNMQQELYPAFLLLKRKKERQPSSTPLSAAPTDQSTIRRTDRLDRSSSISPIKKPTPAGIHREKQKQNGTRRIALFRDRRDTNREEGETAALSSAFPYPLPVGGEASITLSPSLLPFQPLLPYPSTSPH